MALSTYAELKTSVASWLHRDDLADLIPDFIALAEARIARDFRLRVQIATSAISTVAASQTVTLPAGFLEFENLSVSSSIERQLSYVTPEQLDARFPSGSNTGIPAVYTIIGEQIYFGPTPDAVYTVNAIYYKRFDALANDADTNWLLTYHPSIYLFAACAEAAPWMLDDARIQVWEQKYAADAKALQSTDDESIRSGSSLRVRALP